jgi:hypothetical protein
MQILSQLAGRAGWRCENLRIVNLGEVGYVGLEDSYYQTRDSTAPPGLRFNAVDTGSYLF